MFTNGNHSGMTIVYNDAANTLNLINDLNIDGGAASTVYDNSDFVVDGGGA